MTTKVLFFHGGGSKEDYDADQKLADSLQAHLGASYAVSYPYLPNDGSPDLGRRRQIEKQVANSEDGLMLVGHSLGASMLLAWLSEFESSKKITGVFLLAAPFWEGDEDWAKAFKLNPGFETRINRDLPLFFYHNADDEVVPIAQLNTYQKLLPWATFRKTDQGGHQFNDDLNRVAEDIRSL